MRCCSPQTAAQEAQAAIKWAITLQCQSVYKMKVPKREFKGFFDGLSFLFGLFDSRW